MTYIDWEWYNSHFPKLTEDKFKEKLPQAEMIVEMQTRYRSKTAEGYKMEAVKACVANVLNTLADQEAAGAGSGVKSVSNDGYSESYENTTREQADNEIYAVCRLWLSGTGLMGAL